MNREEWLGEAAKAVAPLFEREGKRLPENLRFSIGFPGGKKGGKAIGQCWDSRASADGVFEIFITPTLEEEDKDRGLRALDVLVHELVHAVVGLECGHKGAFAKLAKALGLEGKMTATKAGSQLTLALEEVIDSIGPIPHGKLNVGGGLRSGPKSQKNRHVKCECGVCGYAVRTARKWIDEIGLPHCPQHGEMELEGGEPQPD